MIRRFTALVSAISVAGCASTPDVDVTYYLPKSSLELTVIRTFGCSDAGQITAISSVVSSVSYSAGEPRTLNFRAFDDWFADTTTDVSFREDGRLSGINTAQTGQGSEIVKAGLAIAQSAAGVGITGSSAKSTAAGQKPARSSECNDIRDSGMKDGVPLMFSYSEDFSRAPSEKKQFIVHPDSAPMYEKLKRVVHLPCISVAAPVQIPAPVVLNTKDTVKINKIFIRMRQPAKADVAVFIDDVNPLTPPACDQQLWSSRVNVPQLGEEYSVPVLRPAPFGKQTFGVALAESGAVTSIKYGKDVGLTSSMSAGTTILSAQKGETASEEAARLQAEADVIHQHHRLMACRLNAETCPG